MPIARGFDDGEVLRLGDFNSFCELFLDKSATIVVLQSPTSGTSNTALDRLNLSTTETVINEDGADRDTRFEGDTNANLVVLDAGLDAIAFGGAVVAGAALTLRNLTDRTQVTAVGTHLHLPAQTFNDSGSAATKAIFGAVLAALQTLTATNAITYSDAATLYIAGAPVASTNVTISSGWAAWFDTGSVRVDGTLIGPSGLIVRFGGSAAHATTAGTNIISLYTGTAPVGTISTGGSLYVATATNVELNYIDSAGNAQQLSTT